MTATNVVDDLFEALSEIMTAYAMFRARSMANYCRKLATKVRGINCNGNITMVRKNYGIADEMNTLAFNIQHNAISDPEPERFMEASVTRVHRLSDGAVRPR